MKNILSFLGMSLTVFLLSSSSCKKEQAPQSELVTVNGQTFGCRVDGVTFIADKWDYGNNIPPVSITFSKTTYGGATLIVTARKQNEYIQIFLNKPLIKGTINLNENTQPYPVYDPPKNNGVYKKTLLPSAEFITSPASIGSVNLIEIDTISLKVSATFEFIGTDKSTGQQVRVTNGIFKNF
jgi:hypothetical protein